MSQLMARQEDILDLEGQPLLADGALFLKTMDNLLTVGAYYSADHHQYQAGVQSACSSLLRAIEPRPALAAQITTGGIMILDQTVDAGHRNARKLHDLLVSLNIVKLEFRAGLTPQDLHAALERLKQHRIDLDKGGGFQKVAIGELPDTVRIASRLISTGDVEGLLAELGEDSLFARSEGAQQTREGLARVFMELAEQLLTNLESTLALSLQTDKAGLGTAVTREELENIREGLIRLLEQKPDPRELLRLIKHARMAVDLSQDTYTVDLAFKILRSQMSVRDAQKNKEQQTNRWVLEEDLSFSAEALHQAVAGLEYAPAPLARAGESARCDQLAVAFTLLSGKLETREKARVLNLIEAALRSEDCGPAEMAVIARGLRRLVVLGKADADIKAGRWLSAVLGHVREHQPGLLAGLWTEILPAVGDAEYAGLWPYLVNDLLLGFPRGSGMAVGALWARAGEASMELARQCLPCLQALPALGSNAKEPDTTDLMALPLGRTRPLHAVLMKSRFADRHGPHLLRALQRQSSQGWMGVLVQSLEDYFPEHRKFLFALIREAGRPRPSAGMREMAGRILVDQLADLPRSRRAEDWVAQAVSMLPALAGEDAGPLLSRVCRERRLFFFRAWPEACRKNAEAALAGMKTGNDGEDHGHDAQ